ncbi:uncharacterized protein LOC135152914 [Daucus carota subsp. sativus]|uniref:uncharacterized protein LOC135152914 n=1 Tax=Daucus carota subsp. sativus TaxID=79200 RepID=UPI0030833654
MAAMKAEIERLNAENARFKSGELVTLQEKIADTSFTSLKKELDDHVKGIHSRMDKFDKNQELCMTKLDNLEQTLAQVVQQLKINQSTSQSTPEDPSTKGEKDKEDKDDNTSSTSSEVDEEIICKEQATAEAETTVSDSQIPVSDHGPSTPIPHSPMKIPEDAIVHDTAPENYKSDVVVEEPDKVAVEALQSLAKAGEEPSKSKVDAQEKFVQDPVEKVANPASDNDEDDDSSDDDNDENDDEVPLSHLQQKT